MRKPLGGQGMLRVGFASIFTITFSIASWAADAPPFEIPAGYIPHTGPLEAANVARRSCSMIRAHCDVEKVLSLKYVPVDQTDSHTDCEGRNHWLVEATGSFSFMPPFSETLSTQRAIVVVSDDPPIACGLGPAPGWGWGP
jgi:hypothetical protein